MAFALVEALAGLWSGSLALISDAGHMFTDAMALGLAAGASNIASRHPGAGIHRAELFAVAVNAALMTAVIAWIVYEAQARLAQPVPIKGVPMLVVAVLGLSINGAVAWILSRGEQTLNTRAARLHVIGDALGSAAAVIAALVIVTTGWTPIDPILSLFVAALIGVATLSLLREAWRTARGVR